MKAISAINKKLLLISIIVVLGALAHFSTSLSYSFIPNRGNKTELRTYRNDIKKCEQACTVNTQGSYSRSSATISLLDELVASIPPGSLVAIIATTFVFSFLYFRRKQIVYLTSNVQQSFCLWRF